MFDLFRWSYEYEPYELDGWIPDFILFGNVSEVLVEVKPRTFHGEMALDDAVHTGVAGKMEHAVRWAETFPTLLLVSERAFHAPEEYEMSVVLGNTATVSCRQEWENGGPAYNWDTALVGRAENDSRRLDFCELVGSFTGVLFGGYDGNPLTADVNELRALWAEAGNEVQWKKPGRVR